MAQRPTITIIQASDAPQHTAKLQEILQTLKTEKRIEDFNTLGADDDFSSLVDNIEEEDLVLILLTRQLEPYKEQIESRLRALKADWPGIRIGEIIVDNVVFSKEFLALPVDLRPIREREDRDEAWSGIEQNLKELLPPIPDDSDGPNLVRILLIALAILLVGWIAWKMIPSKEVKVPDMAEMTLNQARAELENEGLLLGGQREEHHSEIQRNRVIRSNPPADRIVEEGTRIALYISLGPEQTHVPDVAGMTLTQARTELEDEGLRLGSRRREHSQEIQRNRVIRSDPPANSTVERGSLINLFSSLGPEPGRLIHARANQSKCMHKRQNNWNNGNPIHLWDCDAGTAAFKSWIYEAETGYIRSAENQEKCMHKRENNWNNGNPIHLWDCDAGVAAFKTWVYEAGTGYIRSAANPEKCMHKRQNNWSNGNPVHLWDCDAGVAAFKSWTMK